MSFLSQTTLLPSSIGHYLLVISYLLPSCLTVPTTYLRIQDPWQPNETNFPSRRTRKTTTKGTRKIVCFCARLSVQNQSTTRSFIHPSIQSIHSSSYFTLDWAVSEIGTPLLPLTHSKELPHYVHPNSSNFSIIIIWPETRTSKLSDHST